MGALDKGARAGAKRSRKSPKDGAHARSDDARQARAAPLERRGEKERAP